MISNLSPWDFFKGDFDEDEIMFTFWKKSKSGLPGPKELPVPVGRDIVTKHGGNPDKIWDDFRAVSRPREGYKDTFEVRVFNRAQAASQKIKVEDYNSLTDHPELILYDGWYDTLGGAEIEKR